MGAYPSGANGRAFVDPRRPQAFAICDRCGFRYLHRNLSWQYEWRGAQLQNLRILVCDKCNDEPNEQLRAYAVPPDPLPILNPRPDLSCQGDYPTIVNTIACTPTYWLRDGFGNLILDGLGNPILLELGTYGTLIAADPSRTMINFTIPPSFGIWLNPTGGLAMNGGPGCVFYAPNSYYEASGVAAQNAITYYTTIAGLQFVVQTEECDLFFAPPITNTGLFNDGGVLILQGDSGWPGGTTVPGGFYSNGGVVSIYPGGTVNPAATPVFYGQITASALFPLGGTWLPTADPFVPTQIFTQFGEAHVSNG